MVENDVWNLFGRKVEVWCRNKGKGKMRIGLNRDGDVERIMEIVDCLKKRE